MKFLANLDHAFSYSYKKGYFDATAITPKETAAASSA
jgi:hypothetical protein